MKKAFLMMALLVLPFALHAQAKFHDVEANDAKGAVKSITTSVMGNTQKVTFTEEGKMQQDGLSNVVYDDNGYVKSAEVEAQGMKMTLSYTWENGRVKSQSTSIMGQQMSTTNIYNEKGEIIKQVINMGGQEMNAEYSDYKYDDHGNWISRKASIMGQQIDAPRTIEYYK